MLRRTLYDVSAERYPEKAAEIEADAARFLAEGLDEPPEDEVRISSPSKRTMVQKLLIAEAKAISKQSGRPFSEVREAQLRLMRRDEQDFMRMVTEWTADYFALLSFRMAGSKSFEFSDALTERLLRTDLNVTSDLVRLPFRTCQMTFGEALTPAVLRAVTDEHPSEVPPDDLGETSSSFVVTLRDVPGGRRMVFEGALLRQTHGSGPVMAMARTLDLPDGCDVAGAISRSNGRDGGKAETDRIFSMLLNAALYLTSRAPDVEPERKVSDLLREGLEGRGAAVRRRFAPRIASSGERTLFRVGENLPPIVFSGPAPGQGPDDATPGGGGRLTRRFLVRGHWRNQAHGPGMALRRPVFIEPFEKGPDIGDTINRPFLVDDDGRDVGFDPGLQTTLFDPSS